MKSDIIAVHDHLQPVELERMSVLVDALPALTVRGPNRALAARLIEADDDVPAIWEWLREFTESPKTLRTYRREVERFYNWLVICKGKDLASVTRADIHDYTEFMTAPPAGWCQPRYVKREPGVLRPFEGPLPASSRAHALVVVGAFFQWLCDSNYLAGNPFRVKRRKRTGEVRRSGSATPDRFLEFPVAELLVRALERFAAHAEGVDGNQRREAERQLFVVRFLLNTGLRRDELANAQMLNIRPVYKKGGAKIWMMSVVGKGNVVRDIGVNDAAREALTRYRASLGASQQYAQNACAMLLPLSGESQKARFLGEQSVYAIVKKAIEAAAGILEHDHPDEAAHIRRITPHWFRHTYASVLDSLGVSLKIIQVQLGHESIDTTAIYTDKGESERYDAVSRLAL